MTIILGKLSMLGKRLLNAMLSSSTDISEGSLGRMCLALGRRIAASDFFRKVAESLGTRFLIIGLGLVIAVLVARILGPGGRGLYAVAATVAGIGVQFGNLGLYASNNYFVARNRQLLPELLGISLVVSFGFGGLIAGIAYAVFTSWPKLAPVSGLTLIIPLIWVPFGLAYLLQQNLLLGLHKIRDYNKIELISKAIGVLFFLLLVAGHWLTVNTALITGLVAVILGFAWSLAKLRDSFAVLSFPSYRSLKEQFFYSVKAYVAAFFAFLIFRINLLMIKFMLNPEQAGWYSIASLMAEMMLVLPAVAGMILFPKLAAMATLVEKWRFTKKVAIGISLFMLVATIGMAFLAKPMIRLAFGAAFAPSLSPFLWLLPAIFIYSITTCLMNFFAAIGMPMITCYASGLALLVNFLLNLILISSWKIAGASISTSVASGVMLAASLIYIAKLRIPADDENNLL
jgi:O-antigen/teichoic acid export membrane protein